MKKRVIIVLSVVVLIIITLLIAAFVDFPQKALEDLNLAEGIIMTIKEETLTKTGVTILITNESDIKYYTGRGYGIDQFIDGKWYRLDLKEEMIVTADALSIIKDDPLDFTINWERYYGSLESGKYRIIKSVSSDDKPKENKDIAVEFVID